MSEVLMIDVGEIKPGPNARRDPTPSDSLLKSIERQGVLQPILVRPGLRGGYVLVAGARRHRACEILGLDEIPALSRDLSAEEAEDANLLENLEREALPLVDEASAIAQMLSQGVEIGEVAARLGRSESYVRRRRTIATLPKEMLDKVRDGTMAVGVAELIAAIEDPEDRAKAYETLEQTIDLDSVSQARSELAWCAGGKLDRVSFDLEDESFEGAPACTTCPSNTTSEPGLWGNEPSDSLCLDIACLRRKKDEHAARMQADAAERNVEVKKVRRIESAGTVRLDRSPRFGDDMRTWSDILGDHELPTVLQVAEDGQVAEVVDEKQALECAIEVGNDWAKGQLKTLRHSEQSSDDAWAKQVEKRKKAHKLRKGVAARAIEIILSKVTGEEVGEHQAFFKTLMLGINMRPMCKPRNWAQDEIEARIDELSPAEYSKLAVHAQLLESPPAGGEWGEGFTAVFHRWCDFYGVDLKELTKEERKTQRALARKKKVKKAGAAK